MNCKPGDLAIIVRPKTNIKMRSKTNIKRNLGIILRVVAIVPGLKGIAWQFKETTRPYFSAAAEIEVSSSFENPDREIYIYDFCLKSLGNPSVLDLTEEELMNMLEKV